MSPLVNGNWIDDEPSAGSAGPAPDVASPAPIVAPVKKPWWLLTEYDQWTKESRYWDRRAQCTTYESDRMVKRIWVLLMWMFCLSLAGALLVFVISVTTP